MESFSLLFIYNVIIMKKYSLFLFLTLLCVAGYAQNAKEKTTFQTAAQWKPTTDIRSDIVMVYGANDHRNMTFPQRVRSWRDHGYTAHFMTGIAWGEYQDYFTGKWDGRWHLDEGQKTMNGDTIWHGQMTPYIVPSENYIEYFKQRHIKPVIDQGIDAIFLEEPEFWTRAGYSEGFKKEWKAFYGFEWRPQHESAENTYLSNKLKYHLYYRALDESFKYAKAYGEGKGLDVRCYVPTHSLLNYSQWQIISPEASLASMRSCDGYIAQIWTGTSREPNYFNGKAKERVFETAYLEYGCMESMTRPTQRKMFFLTDPIEDWRRDWADYKQNYQATYTAQLMWPQIDNFEVMPWPDRIYEGLYNESATSDKKIHIPPFYATQMQVMINALNDVPRSDNAVSGSQGISVAMSNSLMFQRSPQPVENYDDPQLSNFYGEALPLVKRGVPVNILHLENTGYPETWVNTKVLLLSYSNMKPMERAANDNIAQWVKNGGVLIYSSRDDDPFQRVMEWWNRYGNDYAAPSEHLFESLGLDRDAKEGRYEAGKGVVYVIRQNPKEFVMTANGDAQFIKTVAKAYEQDAKAGRLEFKNSFALARGNYDLVSVIDENVVSDAPYVFKGCYIDLFDNTLPVLKKKIIKPGQQAFLYNINKVVDKNNPQVLAAASRQYDEVRTTDSYSFIAKSPINTVNIMRVLLPKKPKKLVVNGNASPIEWDSFSKTLLISFDNDPSGVPVNIYW